MAGCFVFVLLVVAVVVIHALITKGEEANAAQQVCQQITKAAEKGLTVRCADDWFEPDDETRLPVKDISISGSILVPREDLPAMIRIRVKDVTESGDEALPVFCRIPDCCDEDGEYAVDQEITIPYQFSEVTEMPVGSLPIFAFIGPRSGRRRIQVGVFITPEDTWKPTYAFGISTFIYTQEAIGYVEFNERSQARERQIATLALAVAASDGHIDRRDSTVIRRFFSEIYASSEDSKSRRQAITKTLQETLSQLKSGQQRLGQLIQDLCRELREDGEPAVVQTAYELCVQVTAADDTVDKRERRVLAAIADRLGLSSSFIQEAHDRNLRTSMYDDTEEEHAIGMPRGLSDEEKRQFLNQEYRKWRARVTHRDPQVATEASLRLERITKLRRQLTDA